MKSISGVYLSLQRAALSSPLPSVEETPEKAKRHRPPPYLYTVGGNTSQSPLNTGRLCHLKSKALSEHMVVFSQQCAEKYLLFLQFFPLSDVYSSLKHHTPYAESFHPHIKEPLILPSVFGLVKKYSSLLPTPNSLALYRKVVPCRIVLGILETGK